MKNGRSCIHLSQPWLIKIAADIENGETTLLEASKHAEVIIKDKSGFPHVQIRIVSPGTVKREMKEIGIELNIRPGRRHTTMLSQIEDAILREHERTKMGATKVYEQIVAKSGDNPLFQNITHSMVYKTFITNYIIYCACFERVRESRAERGGFRRCRSDCNSNNKFDENSQI